MTLEMPTLLSQTDQQSSIKPQEERKKNNYTKSNKVEFQTNAILITKYSIEKI